MNEFAIHLVIHLAVLISYQEKIDALLIEMKSDSYQTRETATNELFSLADKEGIAVIHVLRRHICHKDPEVRFRVRRVLNGYYVVANDDGELPAIYGFNRCFDKDVGYQLCSLLNIDVNYDRGPWISLCRYYYEQTRLYTGRYCQILATAYLTHDLLDAGWTRKEVRDLLNVVSANENS